MNDLETATLISPLREELIDDMTMRRFSRETQRNYIRDVARFATLLRSLPARPPRRTCAASGSSSMEVGISVPTINSIVAALRFFFTHTLDRPEVVRKLVPLAHQQKLPLVLSRDEVAE